MLLPDMSGAGYGGMILKIFNNQSGMDTSRSEWILARALEWDLRTFKMPDINPLVAGS